MEQRYTEITRKKKHVPIEEIGLIVLGVGMPLAAYFLDEKFFPLTCFAGVIVIVFGISSLVIKR